MPWWMKFYMQVRKPIEGDGDDLGGGSDDAGGDGGDVGGDGGQGGDADAGGGAGGAGGPAGGGGGGAGGDELKTGADLTDGMRAAIEQGLKHGEDLDADGAAGGPAGGKAAADAAAGDPGKAKGDDAAGKKVAPAAGKEPGATGSEGEPKKPAKADDFQLTAEDKKNLSPRAIGRFHELHKHAKTVEAEVERYRTENTTLQQARDTIVGVLEETHTTQEELSGYLNFNYMLKTGNLEDALKLVEDYRTTILQKLGREAPGYDPIAEHKDLKQLIDDGDMTREAALEVVQARNIKAQNDHQRQRHETTARSAQEAAAVQESALKDIEAWNRKMAQSDREFPQKAAILEPKLKGLMSRYPPNLWPQVIQDAYDAIVITGTPAPARQGGTGGGNRPSGDGTLRPRSGGRPGAAAPGSLGEAISQGLGYSQ